MERHPGLDQKLEEFGVIIDPNYPVFGFKDTKLNAIYWNTQLQRFVDARNSVAPEIPKKDLTDVDIEKTQVYFLLSQISIGTIDLMRKKKIEMNRKIIDKTMFIITNGFISITYGSPENCEKYKEAYSKWVEKNPIERGPDYFVVKERLEDIFEKAHELHEQVIQEFSGESNQDNPPPEPFIWLKNEIVLRKAWKSFQKPLLDAPEHIVRMMMDNITSKYMAFMNDNFPVGFGESFDQENTTCLFYRLSKK